MQIATHEGKRVCRERERERERERAVQRQTPRFSGLSHFLLSFMGPVSHFPLTYGALPHWLTQSRRRIRRQEVVVATHSVVGKGNTNLSDWREMKKNSEILSTGRVPPTQLMLGLVQSGAVYSSAPQRSLRTGTWSSDCFSSCWPSNCFLSNIGPSLSPFLPLSLTSYIAFVSLALIAPSSSISDNLSQPTIVVYSIRRGKYSSAMETEGEIWVRSGYFVRGTRTNLGHVCI